MMNAVLRYFILIAVVVISQTLSWSQSAHIRFDHLSVADGLSQNSVRCLLQDSKGFMWFGTEEGLNRYDGYNFKLYQNRANDTTSLSGNDIRSIIEDSRGFIWVGTTAGLNILDRNTNNFRRIRFARDTGDMAKRNFIFSLYEDREGDVWIGTLDGFYLYRHQLRSFEYFGAFNGEPLLQTMSFYQDRNERFWIGTETSFYHFNKKNGEVRRYGQGDLPISLTGVPSVIEDKNGALWVGTYNGLLRGEMIETTEGALPHYQFRAVYPELADFRANKNMIRCMTTDIKGNIWIGTFDGLLILNPEKESFWGYQQNESLPGSLSANFIRAICRDKRGDIWLGTIMGGINIYHADNTGFKSYLSDWARTRMQGRIVHALDEDDKGNLWVGTREGGLSYLDIKNEKVTTYIHQDQSTTGISINEVRAVMADQRGQVWISTYFGGLNRLDPETQKFTHYRHRPAEPYSLSAENSNDILEDSHGRIWIATHGGGLDLYDPSVDGFRHYRHDPFQDNSLSSNILVSLFEDSEEQLWIATRHSGLNKMDLCTGKITRFRYQGGENGSISSDAVTVIHQDEKGILWVGTEDAGLNRYNSKTGCFTAFRKTDGLPSDAIHGILEDEKGALWLSTNKGLSRFDPDRKLFTNYDQSDGLADNQFIRNSSLKNSKGQLLFGGINGFTLLEPEKIQQNGYVPPVIITGFQLFNREVPIGSRDSPLQQHISQTSEITLKNHQSVFSFDFVALNYLHSAKNQYAYRLIGLDDEWNYVGGKRSVDFTTLPAGEYVFQVKASNNAGIWNEVGESIRIQVLPPWFKTGWAYSIYAVVLGLLLLAYRNFSLLRLREKHELKLVRLEKEKAEEINAMKLRFFTDISHELRTPLTLVLGPIEKLTALARGHADMKKYLATIQSNGNYLLKLINELMDFRKVEAGKMTVCPEEADLVQQIASVERAFQQRAEQDRIGFQVITDLKKAKGLFDIGILYKVLYNLLSNAFKFTPAGGKVLLKLSAVRKDERSYFRIDITDNGTGIPEKDLDQLFQPFYQVKGKSAKNEIGTGIGLALTKRLVELHEGFISVSSRAGQGTTFRVELPALRHLPASGEKTLSTGSGIWPPADAAHDGEKESVVAPSRPSSKPKILLVEDNDQMRHYLVDCLREHYEIIAVSNGQEGWEATKTAQPEVIVTDIMMPTMDGIELCHKLKKDILTSHIPVIFLTARTSVEHRIKGLLTGADAYLTKPFSSDHLHAVIQNLLFNRKQLWKAFSTGNFTNRTESMLGPLDQRFMDQIQEVVDRQLKNAEFNVEQFAREMAMSRSYFHRKLKALTGFSASEFLRDYRLRQALGLMIENKLTISEIAYEVGFSSPNYFGRCFRKKYGKSPSEYLEELQVNAYVTS